MRGREIKGNVASISSAAGMKEGGACVATCVWGVVAQIASSALDRLNKECNREGEREGWSG